MKFNPCLPFVSRHRPRRKYSTFCYSSASHHTHYDITQDEYLQIRSRLYASEHGQPVFIPVPTLGTQAARFPLLENHIAGLRIQPFIHDCLVVVRQGRRSHRFRVFCKNHSSLPINRTIRNLGNTQWRGDIMIMRVGKKHSVVNMRGCTDAKLSDFLVQE